MVAQAHILFDFTIHFIHFATEGASSFSGCHAKKRAGKPNDIRKNVILFTLHSMQDTRGYILKTSTSYSYPVFFDNPQVASYGFLGKQTHCVAENIKDMRLVLSI